MRTGALEGIADEYETLVNEVAVPPLSATFATTESYTALLPAKCMPVSVVLALEYWAAPRYVHPEYPAGRATGPTVGGFEETRPAGAVLPAPVVIA
jgi:hypothetical protein